MSNIVKTKVSRKPKSEMVNDITPKRGVSKTDSDLSADNAFAHSTKPRLDTGLHKIAQAKEKAPLFEKALPTDSAPTPPIISASVTKKLTTKSASKKIMLQDLCEVERHKVENLIKEHLNLKNEHEFTLSELSNERSRYISEVENMNNNFNTQITIVEEKILSKDHTIVSLETKNKLLLAMLGLYQGKIKNLSDISRFYNKTESDLKNKVATLQADLVEHQTIIANQTAALESIDKSRELNEKSTFLHQKQEFEEKIASLEATVSELKQQHDSKYAQLESILQLERETMTKVQEKNTDLRRKVTQLNIQLAAASTHTNASSNNSTNINPNFQNNGDNQASISATANSFHPPLPPPLPTQQPSNLLHKDRIVSDNNAQQTTRSHKNIPESEDDEEVSWEPVVRDGPGAAVTTVASRVSSSFQPAFTSVQDQHHSSLQQNSNTIRNSTNDVKQHDHSHNSVSWSQDQFISAAPSHSSQNHENHQHHNNTNQHQRESQNVHNHRYDHHLVSNTQQQRIPTHQPVVDHHTTSHKGKVAKKSLKVKKIKRNLDILNTSATSLLSNASSTNTNNSQYSDRSDRVTRDLRTKRVSSKEARENGFQRDVPHARSSVSYSSTVRRSIGTAAPLTKPPLPVSHSRPAAHSATDRLKQDTRSSSSRSERLERHQQNVNHSLNSSVNTSFAGTHGAQSSSHIGGVGKSGVKGRTAAANLDYDISLFDMLNIE